MVEERHLLELAEKPGSGTLSRTVSEVENFE